MQAQSTVSRPCGRLAVQLPRTPCNVFRSATTSSRAAVHPGMSRLSIVAEASEAPGAVATKNPEPSYAGAADTYAVVDIGGHQLIVEEGRWYTVNRLEAPEGSKINLGRVLALKANGKFHVGKPYLEGITVEAEILEDLKGPKVIVYKMKPKKHYRRTNGHRQPLTKFMVTKISQ
ncbi:hypothetical protein Ndes2437B_g07164 [Nannochloris sp. 'desiccata']|nr:hypothetical protein KSW81_005512 [Chlorella desiccata (nom. nud.)]